jgi:chromosome segregation and condensation protein ScpB
MRGLVERMQSAEGRRSYEYKVTLDFLKHMGLTKTDDLPEFGTFRDILSRYEASAEAEKNADVPSEDTSKQNTEL